MDKVMAEELIHDWHLRGTPQLIPRATEFVLPRTSKAVAIIGPRRAGKTYFLYDIIKNHLSVPITRTLFINLEDHRILSQTVETLDLLLRTYFELFPAKPGEITNIFLDEVQNVSEWERFVRSMLDREDIRIFISGSSSKLLSKEIATSLRGRNISHTVLPFSFREMLDLRGVNISHSSSGKALILNTLREYLRFGGFPDVVLEEAEITKRKTLRQYVDVMLFKDIVERHNISNIKVLKLLMGQMMASNANLFSVNKFYNFLGSQGLKIDKNSIYEYKDHLIDAFGFLELKRVNGSFRTIEQGLPKIYTIDTGYLTDFGIELDNNQGRFIENCIAIELLRRAERRPGMKINYWRDGAGFEVDFVIMAGGKPEQLVQSCFDVEAEETFSREIKGIVKGSVDLKCDDIVLINWEKEKEDVINGKKVKFVPLWKWLLND